MCYSKQKNAQKYHPRPSLSMLTLSIYNNGTDHSLGSRYLVKKVNKNKCVKVKTKNNRKDSFKDLFESLRAVTGNKLLEFIYSAVFFFFTKLYAFI